VDVVTQTRLLLDSDVAGIFNCVGGGPPARRIDYVAAILDAAGSQTRVVPRDFARRAPVSTNEAALNARLRSAGLDRMSSWRESLGAYVRAQLADAACAG
jgi:dTDP-4-dehydrorhamnose reductase